jgi:hypothetical protein
MFTGFDTACWPERRDDNARKIPRDPIVCDCYGIELVAKEKSAMQVRSKFRKRYRLRVDRA